MKTAADFEKAAAERNIHFVPNHDCSICGETVGWGIHDGVVLYNSSCGCARSQPRRSSFEDIADFYNRNAGADDALERMAKYPAFKKYVEETNEFWGFDMVESPTTGS